MTTSWSADARPEPPGDWAAFARAHGGFYHEPAWAEALRAAFGFPLTFVSVRDESGALGGVLPLARLRTLAGRHRLVSLPFSYAAGPLATTPGADDALCAAALRLARARRVKRLELKRVAPADAAGDAFTRVSHYATYRVDTTGGEDAVWRRLHADSTRRGIRRAERAGVRVERSAAEDAWALMARLQAETSHRHGLPAPPTRFFTRVCRGLQAAGLADLYVAANAGGAPVGAVTLWKGARAWIYAFGAQEQHALELRPTHALLWRAIRDASAAGAGFDLGRAAPEQAGLVEFKRRWGGEAVPLAYDYAPAAGGVHAAARDRGPVAWANRVWSALPPRVAARGAFLYKFLG